MINEGTLHKQGMFTSKKPDWQTPKWLFEKLDSHFHFMSDVCANDKNFLCDIYYTEQNSCLDKDWEVINFMNPPYGRSIGQFIEKAYYEWWDNDCTTVAVLPARTDTKWFHKYIYNKASIVFMKGRLKFEGGHVLAPAPFPTMIVIWYGMPIIDSDKFLNEDSLQEFINNKKSDQIKLDI